jgi:hypothetical protein
MHESSGFTAAIQAARVMDKDMHYFQLRRPGPGYGCDTHFLCVFAYEGNEHKLHEDIRDAEVVYDSRHPGGGGVYRRKAAEAYAESCDLKARILELEACLRSIHETAHSHSTGPAEPDILWSIYQDAIAHL